MHFDQRTRRKGVFAAALLLLILLCAGFVHPAEAKKASSGTSILSGSSRIARVKLKKAKGAEGQITVTWKPASGISGYIIYRKAENEKDYTLLKKQSKSKGTQYTDKKVQPCVKYTYTVKAYVKKGKTVTEGIAAAEGVTAEAKIPKITLGECTLYGGNIKFKYSKIRGAEGYVIYRKVDKGKYTEVARNAQSSSASYRDTSISKGHKYTYTVRAFVTDANGSRKMGPYYKEGVCAEYPLVAPELNSVTPAEGRILISLKAIPECAGYRFYRRESGEDKYTYIGKVTKSTRTAYWDADVTPGREYSYGVRSYIKDGGKTLLSAMTVYENTVICLPNTPAVTGLSKNGKNNVLTWETVPGAEGYVVEKQNAFTSGWMEACTVGSGKSSASIPAEEIETQYTVRAFAKNGDIKYYSPYADVIYDTPGKLAGQKILFIGDSITWGSTLGEVRAKVPYPEQVSRATGAAYTNAGIPGSTFSKSSAGDSSSVCVRTLDKKIDFSSYTAVFIACGTNDFSRNIPVGTPDLENITFFCGAVNRTIAEIKAQNPKAEIVLMTPIFRTRISSSWYPEGIYNVKNGAGCTLGDYADALVSLAAKNNVRCLDIRTLKLFTKNNADRMLADGLHPTPEGYRRLGDAVTSYLLKNLK